jgi:phosphate butyryltransferase
VSLCSPLSFATITAHDVDSLRTERLFELIGGPKGFVKVTPLKATAALLSEIEKVNSENLNLLVMTLDDLFASVVRKTGPHIIRELAAQDANQALSKFDFARIVECLREENFTIPPHFRLASRDIGTGVGEICELIMIAESGRVSPSLSRSLMHVVDAYARHVAMVLQMSCAGESSERPHYIVVTSMRAIDPNFRKLFGKIRDRIDIPFTPVICLYSFEHEYLIASHLFELYVNRSGSDERLDMAVEAQSMKQALKVLESAAAKESVFSFASLLDEVTETISEGKLKPANIILVGSDNEDALMAVSQARELGLMDRIVLIGDPEETAVAVARTKVPLSPGSDPRVEMIPIDPLAADSASKKKSMAEVFRRFIEEHPDFIVMKGSLDTATILHQALSIYSAGPGAPDKAGSKKVASHTALFVLPNGRFFALSDAGVNPSFKSADALLRVVENQVDVIRKVVDTRRALKVAIITAVEKETSAIPTTILAAETEARSEKLQDRYGPLVVEGPLSFDLATVPEVAAEKDYHGQIQGDADCLVATEINTANVLYKMLSKTVGSLGIMVDNGGIITAGAGTPPIVLTSRGDTAQTKLNSILLALSYSLRVRESR